MNKTLIFSIFIFTTLTTFAQSNILEISGRLINENQEPVQFANIILHHNENDSVFDATVSDENGKFSIAVVKDAKYLLTVSAIGHEKLSIHCGIGYLGDLLMPTITVQLDEVTVQASRITERPDRIIVLPDQKETESAGKGLMLLNMQQLPGLKVDIALQTITVDGGIPILQINGKEVTKERFCSVKSDKIKRIEYINNPGIRYLDRGATGIINLILKEVEDGGNVIASLGSAVTTGFVDGYFVGAYHKGKSELALQYNVNYRNYDNVPFINIDQYLSDNRKVERNQKLSFPFHYNTHNIVAEYTFLPNDSTMFIASLHDYISDNHWKGEGLMSQCDNGVYDTLRMKKTKDISINTPKLDLFFTHKMKNSQKIELNIVGQYSTSTYINQLVYSELENEYEYLTQVKNRGFSVSGEGVYDKQFSKMGLRLGMQYLHNFARNDYLVYNTTSKMIKDNMYLFCELQGGLGAKVSYTLGTGMKYFTVTNKVNRQNYIRNLTTARINWQIDKSWSLTAKVNLDPTLPSLSALSPIMQYVDNVEANSGNELLKPSYRLSNKLMLRYNLRNIFFTNATTGYDYVFEPIIYSYHYDKKNDLFISSPQNADFYKTLYFTAEIGIRQLFQHFNIVLSGTWRKDSSNGEGFSHTHSNFTSNINAQAIWNKIIFGCNFDLIPECIMYGEELTYQNRTQNIYVQYNWKNWYLSLVWHCPFNNDGYKYESEGLSLIHPYKHTNWTTNNGNMIVLGITWQMNYGKWFNKGRKTLWNGGYDDGMVK